MFDRVLMCNHKFYGQKWISEGNFLVGVCRLNKDDKSKIFSMQNLQQKLHCVYILVVEIFMKHLVW